jgi:hypothetical protein
VRFDRTTATGSFAVFADGGPPFQHRPLPSGTVMSGATFAVRRYELG